MTSLPRHRNLLRPVVQAMRDLGGSGSIDEIDERVFEGERFSEKQQAILHRGGPDTEISYRLRWARTFLKNIGLVRKSGRGVWSLTELGHAIPLQDVEPLFRKYEEGMRRGSAGAIGCGCRSGDSAPSDELTWQEQLLGLIKLLSPAAFERLAQRLLREAGFVNTRITGRSGDGGIDGLGLYRLSLVSFPVFFQCKRYIGTVGAAVVRDFRGAMAGRGDKGLLITTGTFTAGAKVEATREGVPPLDLIDGARLCVLLKEYEIGVRVTTRMVENVEVVPGFFNDF